MTNDELAARIDRNAARIDETLARIDEGFERIDRRFDSFETKVDAGFNASKMRDEELRDLTRFGLDAREVLRDEMHRRFDEAERKNDEQISLLKDAVRNR